MKNEEKNENGYTAPSITDFGRVSDVTANVGMTFQTDAAFTGSMAFPGGGMSS